MSTVSTASNNMTQSTRDKLGAIKRGAAMTGKIALIGIIILILLIPLGEITGLVNERKWQHNSAVDEIANKWGAPQTLSGPLLVIPYEQTDAVTVYDKNNKSHIEYNTSRRQAYFLPDKLSVTGDIAPQIRSRGTHAALLYMAQLKVTGHFATPVFPAPPEWTTWKPLWNEAFMIVSVSDAHTITQRVQLHWNDTDYTVESDDRVLPLTGQMLSAKVKLSTTELASADYSFSFDLNLAGSESFRVVPAGRETTVRIKSSWPHPKFDGRSLPTQRNISESGFDASWQTGAYGRGLHDAYFNDFPGKSFADLAFGTSLIFPVDVYTSSYRSSRYGALFLLLTFTVYFLFEIISRKRIHPVQYLLIGFAMCLFYLLLLSLAEHVDFSLAYTCATAAIAGLITIYSYWVLRRIVGALTVGAFQGALYAYLYVLLQAEDYALLLGSVGLLMILATVMFLTRRVDWYRAGETPAETSPET